MIGNVYLDPERFDKKSLDAGGKTPLGCELRCAVPCMPKTDVTTPAVSPAASILTPSKTPKI